MKKKKINFKLLLIAFVIAIFTFMYVKVNEEVYAMSNKIEIPIKYSYNKDYDIEFEIEFIDENNIKKYEMFSEVENSPSDAFLAEDNKINYNGNMNASDETPGPSDNIQNVNITKQLQGSFKSYMSYKTITSKSSLQYKLQQLAYSDYEGFRRIDDYYMIATGSYYGNVGDILLVELNNGTKFYAVKSDMKDDKDTDEENKVCIHDNSVIEFIVDMSCLNKTVKKMGDASYANNFKGPVKNIEIVGKYEI